MKFCYLTVLGFFWTVVSGEAMSCTTPNGEAASCLPLVNCLVLIQAAASNESTAHKFFRESICDEKVSTVCCGTTGNFINSVKPVSKNDSFHDLPKEEKRDYVLKRLLPGQNICGLQHTDDYFYNGTETSVDEFPWLVYIVDNYRQNEEEYYLRVGVNCVGALISNRYVLTSKACHDYSKYPRIKDMLLGLHHIHKTVNCIGTPFGVEDCTDPPLRVASDNWKDFEDVVLIRLEEKINYSDFVRPICLPLQPDEIPTPGSLVMASGWGEEEFVQGKNLKLKKRMKYTVMNNKDCETGNPQKHPICGIPLRNNSQHICNGDIGGPLMYRNMAKNWFAVGVIYQTSENLCDQVQPVTAIRLTTEKVNWIIENIEP